MQKKKRKQMMASVLEFKSITNNFQIHEEEL